MQSLQHLWQSIKLLGKGLLLTPNGNCHIIKRSHKAKNDYYLVSAVRCLADWISLDYIPRIPRHGLFAVMFSAKCRPGLSVNEKHGIWPRMRVHNYQVRLRIGILT